MMQQYLDLMRRIFTEGTRRLDRTGTGTISLFGTQMRFDLKNNNLPLVTSKKVFTRGIIHELLWMLKGDTNAAALQVEKVGIWDGWACPEDVCVDVPLSNYERMRLLAEKLGLDSKEACAMLTSADRIALDENGDHDGGSKLLAEHGIPTTKSRVVIKKGECGPIYGKQWRAWEAPGGRRIDQIAEVIEILKDKPHSRRLVVSAWNPADLPDESVSPVENVYAGRQSLASCHCLFQFDSRPLEYMERFQAAQDKLGVEALNHIRGLKSEFGMSELDKLNAPKYGLSCQLYQRSADYFLGVPFNIASYAMLTAMIAQCCNMIPDEFIWTGGNTHLYSNHFAQVEEQLSRDPRPTPTLHLNPAIKNIDDFKFEDFEIRDYNPHPTIKAPVSI